MLQTLYNFLSLGRSCRKSAKPPDGCLVHRHADPRLASYLFSIPSMNCLLILQLEPTVSCCLLLLPQPPDRRPRPHSHSPRASMQRWMESPTAPVQHRRLCNPPLSLSTLTRTHHSLVVPEQKDVPRQRHQQQFRWNHHLHSTWHMGHTEEHHLHTSKWTGDGESPEHRGNLILSVCSQVSPECKEFRKTCGLMGTNLILQVKINWGKPSKASFPLLLTALNSQKASPGLSQQSLSHLLRTGNVQSPTWGVLSCNPLQGHLHIKLISEAAQHWTDSLAAPLIPESMTPTATWELAQYSNHHPGPKERSN